MKPAKQFHPPPAPELVFRDNGRFAKGHAPFRNGGRPRTRDLRVLLRETTDPAPYVELLLAILRDPRARASDRLAAIKIILDHCEGRPTKPRQGA